MSNGHIILINGESSSGKSTLARALQSSIALPFWHISIDHLRDHGVLPSARIKTGEFDWRSMRDAFFVGFERSLLAYVAAGNNLVVEHIMESEAWARRLADTLQGQDVFFIGVRCDLVELERRERARGDRRIGDARRDHALIHSYCTYDFEVDGMRPAADNAERVIAAWQQRRRPSAFERLGDDARQQELSS
ncbi:MAG: chloramphenicol phosphotransferase CPT family protein [Bosea sp. (in: a-proteobacteria)]